MLAALLSLERIFHADYEDGSLEALALMPLPLEAQVLAKCLAHWLVTGLPLTIIAPLLALFLHLEREAYPVLVLGMALGTPSLTLIGAIGAALTLGARRGGVLLSLLVLPLYIPVLIFGAPRPARRRLRGSRRDPICCYWRRSWRWPLPLTPFAAAAAVRQALE